MLEERIRNLILADTTITDLVADKVYWVQAEETVREPYIVLNFIDATFDYSNDGNTGLAVARIQVSMWANTSYDANKIQEAVLSCLDNYSDNDNPSDVNLDDTYIRVIRVDTMGELFDFSAGQNDSKKYGRRIDFRIFYKL